MGKVLDMTGWVMAEHGVPNSRLIVIEQTSAPPHINNKKNKTYWLCKCSCGNDKPLIYRGDSIRDGSVLSCGCYNNENRRKLGKQSKRYNRFEICGDYAIGYTQKNESFYVDTEDVEKIRNYCWFFSYGYVIANKINRTGFIRLHRFVLNAPDDMFVDHINHKPEDCRKINLRLATPTENNLNQVLRRDNKSGCTGVCWHKAANKWSVEIKYNKQRIYLGLYENLDEAIKVRKDAEEKYFGEFSYDNSMKGAANNELQQSS